MQVVRERLTPVGRGQLLPQLAQPSLASAHLLQAKPGPCEVRSMAERQWYAALRFILGRYTNLLGS